MKLGHVGLDGTKIKANASKHKAMSYERMAARAAVAAEVAKWLSAAEAADAEEDKLFGRDSSGEELPDWVADKKRRAEKIRAAKAELEAEAKAAAEAKAKEQAPAERRECARRRRPPAQPSAEPDPKAQQNFTDPESRIMKTKDGFIQAYNAQAAVDATAQVIVAHGLDAKQNDQHQLVPMPMRSKPIWAGSPRNCRPAPAIAPTPISRRWRSARSTPISRRDGPSMLRKEKAAARASPPCAKKSRPAATPAPIA